MQYLSEFWWQSSQNKKNILKKSMETQETKDGQKPSGGITHWIGIENVFWTGSVITILHVFFCSIHIT